MIAVQSSLNRVCHARKVTQGKIPEESGTVERCRRRIIQLACQLQSQTLPRKRLGANPACSCGEIIMAFYLRRKVNVIRYDTEADLPPYYQPPPLIQPLINKARTLYIDSLIVRKHGVLSIEIIPAFLSDNLTYYIGNSINLSVNLLLRKLLLFISLLLSVLFLSSRRRIVPSNIPPYIRLSVL